MYVGMYKTVTVLGSCSVRVVLVNDNRQNYDMHSCTLCNNYGQIL